MSIKEFNDPCRARFDNNLAQKALRYSIFIFKVCKYLCGVPIFVYFFILPLPRFVISRKLTDLIAMPYQIPYLDGNSIVEVAINITHQLGHGWTCYVYLYFASSYILIVFVYCFIKIQIILDLIKEKQNCETINDDEFQIWHATLIETSRDFTEQLDNHYKSFSWCSFFYIKLCYVTMIVLWLSIKIEPGLRVVGVNFLTFPVFLYLVIALVELVSDKVSFLRSSWRLLDQLMLSVRWITGGFLWLVLVSMEASTAKDVHTVHSISTTTTLFDFYPWTYHDRMVCWFY